MTPGLVAFDLDGTLVDSRRDLADSANDMLRGYGALPRSEDAIRKMIGGGAEALVSRALAAANVDAPLDDALARFLSIYDRRLTRHTRPYDGISDVLKALYEQGQSMALLTNKPLAQSEQILREFGLLDYFSRRVGGDGPMPRKPDPEGLRFLMTEASALPRETVLVGDSTVDLHTARNAGVRICLARYGFGFHDLAASELDGEEGLADDPRDIPAILERLRDEY